MIYQDKNIVQVAYQLSLAHNQRIKTSVGNFIFKEHFYFNKIDNIISVIDQVEKTYIAQPV
jgi:hypothetical protein